MSERSGTAINLCLKYELPSIHFARSIVHMNTERAQRVRVDRKPIWVALFHFFTNLTTLFSYSSLILALIILITIILLIRGSVEKYEKLGGDTIL